MWYHHMRAGTCHNGEPGCFLVQWCALAKSPAQIRSLAGEMLTSFLQLMLGGLLPRRLFHTSWSANHLVRLEHRGKASPERKAGQAEVRPRPPNPGQLSVDHCRSTPNSW